jgi:hypothetical protein
MKYLCPICGYLMSRPAADFNICPSCGVEFGYETSSRSYSELRQEWLETGANWASTVIAPPPNWNAFVQLRNLESLIPQKVSSATFKFQWTPLIFDEVIRVA